MVKEPLEKYWQSLSYVGLVVATLFFSASVTPSLLPRPYYVQGLLSGFAIAIGYGLAWPACCCINSWNSGNLANCWKRWSKRITTVVVAGVFVWFLWRMTFWQNSIRALMQLPELRPVIPIAWQRSRCHRRPAGCIDASFPACLRRLSALLNRLMPRRIALVRVYALSL